MTEYKTAQAFKQALNTRLQAYSKNNGVDNSYLHRIVAIDVFLSRLQKDHVSFFLKGGYAMELRMAINRTTKDVDISYASEALYKLAEDKQQQELLQVLRGACAKKQHDFFIFEVGEPIQTIDKAYGGARFPIKAFLDGRKFSSFGLDIVIGDNELEPTVILKSNDFLSFADISPTEYRAISADQQFAEKLHAYTNPTWEENSRVKDLIDMVLLINDGKLDLATLLKNTETIFGRRNTHILPNKLLPPPLSWEKTYKVMANPCKLDDDYLKAYDQVKLFIEPILGKLQTQTQTNLQLKVPLVNPISKMSQPKTISAKIAHVSDFTNYEIVLNKGRIDGIVEGQRFLVYSLGEIIIDPETGEQLEVLEIPKGKGVITHVQDRISHLRCTTKAEPRRKTYHPLSTGSKFNPFDRPQVEEEMIIENLPFEDAKVGDFARLISIK